jgi:hypothetical protein
LEAAAIEYTFDAGPVVILEPGLTADVEAILWVDIMTRESNSFFFTPSPLAIVVSTTRRVTDRDLSAHSVRQSWLPSNVVAALKKQRAESQ